MEQTQLKYLKVLSEQYPTIAEATTEIINLQAILHLPKGTEHFITDVHGEYEQYQHILRNGSGAIKRKIDEEFRDIIGSREKKKLATLIYYPEQTLEQIERTEDNLDDWYRIMLCRLIVLCKKASSKYTRSKVRKALPKDFAYVIEELLSGRPDETDQEEYYNAILDTIIQTGRVDELIVALSNLVRRFVVDHLHMVGDIFDRGPYPYLIMDDMMEHHSVDIQWGNHDILWMGAAAGNPACICNVIRIAAKYGNLSTLEEGYGINLVPLARYAMDTYTDDPCERFKVDFREDHYDVTDASVDAKMHKAIAIMQFKLEEQIMKRHPDFEMENRKVMELTDWERLEITLDGQTYPLIDHHFPTVDPKNPAELTAREQEVIERLIFAFTNCEKLQKHIRFLYSKGSLYKIYNGNLLYHGCMILNENGSFKDVNVLGHTYNGKKLYDVLDTYARQGYYAKEGSVEKQNGLDMLWFMWKNRNSPVFGKDKMTTFERYFIEDPKTHQEKKNPYYSLLSDEDTAMRIMEEFGLTSEESHIVNGHIPIESKKGESPIKCNGKLLIIDGGLSKAYQPKTGIAGYTLIYNSYGLLLAAHEPFTSIEEAVENGIDVHSHTVLVQKVLRRKLVADTDIGAELRESIQELEGLLEAYRAGLIPERK